MWANTVNLVAPTSTTSMAGTGYCRSSERTHRVKKGSVALAYHRPTRAVLRVVALRADRSLHRTEVTTSALSVLRQSSL